MRSSPEPSTNANSTTWQSPSTASWTLSADGPSAAEARGHCCHRRPSASNALSAIARMLHARLRQAETPSDFACQTGFHFGGAKGFNPDLLIANETRYQLRYSPRCCRTSPTARHLTPAPRRPKASVLVDCGPPALGHGGSGESRYGDATVPRPPALTGRWCGPSAARGLLHIRGLRDRDRIPERRHRLDRGRQVDGLPLTTSSPAPSTAIDTVSST